MIRVFSFVPVCFDAALPVMLGDGYVDTGVHLDLYGGRGRWHFAEYEEGPAESTRNLSKDTENLLKFFWGYGLETGRVAGDGLGDTCLYFNYKDEGPVLPPYKQEIQQTVVTRLRSLC